MQTNLSVPPVVVDPPEPSVPIVPLPTMQVYSNMFYKEDIFHIGIMAQDFFKEFGLGVSEKKVTALDIAGVNMAAIKGLLEKIELLEQKVKTLEN